MAELATAEASTAALLAAPIEAAKAEPLPAQPSEKPTAEELQAKYDAIVAEREQLVQKLKTIEGRGRARERDEAWRTDIQAAIAEQGVSLDALTKTMAAMVRHRGTEDDAALTKEFDEISQQSVRARANSSYQRTLDKVVQEIFTSAKDDEGKQILDPETAPELVDFRAQLREAHQNRDAGGLSLALNEFHRVMNRKERELLKAQHQAELKAAREEKKKALQEAAVNDVDVTGGESAGGIAAATPDNIDALWVAYDQKYPGRKNPYDAQYRALLGR